MSVRYRFTVEIYGFRNSLCTCLACDAHDGWMGRELIAQQKDERQDNHDRRQLHISTRAIYFACWPVNGICERAAQHRLCFDHHHSSDQTLHVLGVRHMMRMRIPSVIDLIKVNLQPLIELQRPCVLSGDTRFHTNTAVLFFFVVKTEKMPVLVPDLKQTQVWIAFSVVNATTKEASSYQKRQFQE